MKTLRSGWGRHGLVIILLSLLSGCYVSPFPREPVTIPGTPPPFSCEKINDPRWQEFRFGVDSADEAAPRISRNWEIDSKPFTPYEYESGASHLSWKDAAQGISYAAHFREKILRSIEVEFKPTPTLAQVLDCLGPPESYGAYLEHENELTVFVMDLYYLEKGYVFTHSSLSQQKKPPADLPALRIELLSVVDPGTAEQMIPNVNWFGHLPGVQIWWQCVLRPWPGSIEAIEVESFLDEDARCR